METSLFDALVVLDANSLLHLYRVTKVAREQILSTLERMEDRLWVPHQAAAEFHRHRVEAVKAKMAAFRDMRSTLSQASVGAVSSLKKSVGRLVEFRQYNMADRSWNPEEHGLDEQSILARLDGLMDAALAELRILQDEHDIRPGDVSAEDPVLQKIDRLTRGRIGASYSQRQLMEIVSEAIEFRFPNEIPPGYKDAGKHTPYRAAGDYVLWRQILDRASNEPRHRLIVLVTNDEKSDWWVIGRNGEPVEARSELRQELFEHSGAQLRLLNLSGFLAAAADQFPGSVSDNTVRSVRKSETMARISETVSELRATEGDTAKSNLLLLPPFMFEHLVLALLIAMGYQDVEPVAEVGTPGYSIRAIRRHPNLTTGTTLVEARLSERPVGSDVIRALKDAMHADFAESGIVISVGEFSQAARDEIVGSNVQLIDGRQLLNLLHEYLEIVATISAINDER